MLKLDYHTLGIILLVIFFIYLLITLLYINPLIEEEHPEYNQTELEIKYGFYIPHVICPYCHSDNLTIYASHINEDNKNKKITSFFYCENCSTIFSVRPSK